MSSELTNRHTLNERFELWLFAFCYYGFLTRNFLNKLIDVSPMVKMAILRGEVEEVDGLRFNFAGVPDIFE